MRGRLLCYRTADRPPWFAWNRYHQPARPGLFRLDESWPAEWAVPPTPESLVTIGFTVRVGRRRVLSIVWRQP